MTKAQALFNFWMLFRLPAYNEQSVPTGENKPDYPYITFQVSTGDITSDVMLNASIWDKIRGSYSADAELDKKVSEIENYIGLGGIIVPCDGGALWIKKGNPFSQNMGDASDTQIRRRLLTIQVGYITE